MSPSGCTATINEHVHELLGLMMEMGMGGGCETAYHAVVEVAEAIRIANNYLPYAPTLAAGIVEQMLADDDNPAIDWN